MIDHVRSILRSASPDERDDLGRKVYGECAIAAQNPARRVGARMNLHGELTAVAIEPPDLDYEPQGWDWRAEALTELVNSLSERVASIRAGVDGPEPSEGPR